MANYNTANTAIPEEERSCFDGGYFAYIGYSILVGLVSVITLGIAYPWMCCLFQRWKAKHTVICGKRMCFDGTGAQLFGRLLLWSFLTVITCGIFGLWMVIFVRKWITKHTHYEGQEDNNSYFDGGVLGMIGTNLLAGLVTVVPFVGTAWSEVIKIKWETRHTVVDSRRHIFEGSLGGMFVKLLLWGFLTIITLGIFGLFVPVKFLRWKTENTIDNEHTTQEMILRSEYRSNVHTDAAAFKTNKVGDDMECVSAGITDSMGQEELLALANSGVRAAQYVYVTRYAQEQYTQEPFSGLLKAAAEAEYAPAICLYLQTHDVEETVRADLLTKAADKGQVWAIKTKMSELAQSIAGQKECKEQLPVLKSVVRYADLLKENQEPLTEEETEMVKNCTFAVRRLQSAAEPMSKAKAVGIVIAVLVGVSAIAGLIAGTVYVVTSVVNYVEVVVTDAVEQLDNTIDDALAGLEKEAIEELKETLTQMSTEEILELADEYLPADAKEILDQLPSGLTEDVVERLLPVVLDKISDRLPSEGVGDIIDDLPLGDMEGIVESLPDDVPEQANGILDSIFDTIIDKNDRVVVVP